MKQTIISVIGPSGCGKSQYISFVYNQLRRNGYTVWNPSLLEKNVPQFLETLDSKAQFILLHIGTSAGANMRIEFHDSSGPMDLIGALYGEEEKP
jgi:ABC-type glutathione transport system ATPase component